MKFLPASRLQPECGRGVETYYDPPGARKVAEEIKTAVRERLS
jgi:hypothetical protein